MRISLSLACGNGDLNRENKDWKLPALATSFCGLSPHPESTTCNPQVIFTTVCRFPMALQLSADELRCISDFLGSSVLSYVCQKTWYTLRRRHLSLVADFSNVSRMMRWLKHDDGICTIAIKCKYITQGSMQDLAKLKDAPSLTNLTLALIGNRIGDGGAQAVAALKDAQSLTSLTLDLMGNHIGDTGAQALAALKEAPALKSLTLNLCSNHIGDNGAQALAALKEAPVLNVLTLNLWDNQIGDSGAQALSTLKEAPALRELDLDVWSNQIGHIGARALGMVH